MNVYEEVQPRTSGFVQSNKLKLLIVLGDALAIAAAYTIVLFGGAYIDRQSAMRTAAAVAAATLCGIWTMRSQDLYLARVSAVRVVEITRTARAVTMMTGFLLVGDRVLHDDLYIRDIAVASALTLLFIGVSRSIYRAWLSAARANGAYRRRIAIVGTDHEALRLMDIFTTHAELGMEVVGFIGDRGEIADPELERMWLGDLEQAETLVDVMNISGVVVSPAGLAPGRLNMLIRNLHTGGCHIHLSTGVAGIDSRRLRSMPIAHEPLVYVEAPTLRRTQAIAKRGFDIAVSAVTLVIVSPILVAVALAIKLHDGGPVFFSQRRVGRDGKTFGVLKFRTMAVDAEARLASLTETNERRGPLFKMTNDPRVTRIGHFLRDSSMDEMPQLINVLRGQMSLVGPRPALPSEVEHFSNELRAREQVPPGITGLWQVEARDNPSFEAYRRLDLFYVENWSITLDMMILVGTIEQSLSRLMRVLFPRRPEQTQPSAVEIELG